MGDVLFAGKVLHSDRAQRILDVEVLNSLFFCSL